MLTLLPARCYQYGAARSLSRKLWHIPGSKRRSLLMAGKDDEMFMTRSFNFTPKTTEQHLIVRSDKSVAYVTNSKKTLLDVLYCWSYILTDTKHRAASLRQKIFLYCLIFMLVLSVVFAVSTEINDDDDWWWWWCCWWWCGCRFFDSCVVHMVDRCRSVIRLPPVPAVMIYRAAFNHPHYYNIYRGGLYLVCLYIGPLVVLVAMNFCLIQAIR